MTGHETDNNRRRLQPGERVGDHLVVRSVLGQGGTAVVYEALHTRLGAPVALKVLDVPDAYLQDGMLRMQREAEVCASIDDPHVPRVYDINALPDGTPYVVMEKVSGPTLEEMLAAGPLKLATVLAIADDLLAALEAVHRAGVVHRDIKPANLILKAESSGTYRVRLMDFGVSKSVCREPSDPKLTRAGTVVGTPHYMAPEQITGEAADARADVYATGVVLFEMLSGRMPFEGESTAEVVAAVLRHTPQSLAKLRPEVPAQLEEVVMRAMSPRASERYLTVRDMRVALALCAAGIEQGRVSRLSLMPTPRGFNSRESLSDLDTHFASNPPPAPSRATRRYSILGAGIAVLVGTVGFPRAAKHVSVSDITPAQVAKADVEGQAPPAAPTPSEPAVPPVALQAAELAAEPAPVPEEQEIAEAPQYRLELQRLQIATDEPTEAEPAANAVEPSVGTGVTEVATDSPEARRRAAREREEDLATDRRMELEEERSARRRLRAAEAAMRDEERQQEGESGVLISDYIKQIEAIQRDATDQGDSLPEKPQEAPADSLPPNPYPN
ncbi:MAG: serine/threonine-protein kinase [Myxococcales bacterium]